MIRSLRTRLFLTAWPLIVGAILIVAMLSTRSARVELAEFEARDAPPAQPGRLLGVADSVIAQWPSLRGAGSGTRLEALARALGDSTALLVLDSAGALVATSLDGLTPRDLRLRDDGTLEFTRVTSTGDERRMQRLVMRGITLTAADGGKLGLLFALPPGAPQPSGAQRMVRGIQRDVWIAVLIAAALSALGAWWLAYPVVAQVRRLTHAARDVQANVLATRVRVSSRDELGDLERSFNAMAQSLDATEQAKRQMISDLAHELRTPLTNVIGLLEAMRDGLRAPDAATLRITHDEATLLKRLIDELQELSLADAGALTLDLVDADIRDDITHATHAFQGSQPAPVVHVPATPVVVRVDRQRLAQVMRNLLQNAVTHTPGAGSIAVMLDVETDVARITVSDTGRGIPAGELPFIFDRFHRVDRSRNRATGGMGLGLALSKRMVEGMGGTITAESVEGQGTRVIVSLPLPTQP